jgi:hypothetical protein
MSAPVLKCPLDSEHREQSEQLMARGDPMVVKYKRYLGNLNTLEVHDTDRERSNCRLDQIRPEHRVWYDTLTEAKRDRRYDNCYWCIGGSTR